MAERGVDVELTDAARDLLGDLGYDPTYGARPLKRVISKHLVDPLALGLLKGEFAAGDHVARRRRRRRADVRAQPSARSSPLTRRSRDAVGTRCTALLIDLQPQRRAWALDRHCLRDREPAGLY